jgi:predicted oxidoreductase
VLVAQVIVDGDDVVVKLSTWEKLWAFHGDVRVPLRAIRRIRTPSSPWLTLRGWRVTGVAIPGYVAMGRRRHGAGYDFTMVFKHRPTVVLECNGSEFGEVTVSVDDGAATAARLAAAAGITVDPTE